MSAPDPLFLEAAARIGWRLCRDAIWDGDRCVWLTDSLEPIDGEWRLAHRAAGPDVYAGSAGVALFLARLFALTGDALVRQVAKAAARHAISAGANCSGLAPRGYYSGAPGVGSVVAQAGHVLDSDELSEAGAAFALAAMQRDAGRQDVDLMAGAAGAIAALLQLRALRDDAWIGGALDLEAARLQETANRDDGAWSWSAPASPPGRDLTGLSHGAAGIGWALLELAHGGGRPDLAAGAEAAFEYERRRYDPARNGWPDFRSDVAAADGPAPCAVAWCHGAAGIGLTRLRAHALTADGQRMSEAAAALAATLPLLEAAAASGQGSFTLCHGHGGNAELAIVAGQALGGRDLVALAEAVGTRGLEAAASGAGWISGVPGAGETPGLMTGLAGIGYFYLRLAAPGNVPSVLLPTPAGD
jgi:lantibiotic modifying enzyme